MTEQKKIQENAFKNEIFVSYSRVDKDFAEKIYQVILERNIVAWYDKLISPGANWREIIVEHLNQSRIMLVLLSSNAQKSSEIKKELAVASAQGVPLLGVRLEDVKLSGAFAYELTGLNWFDIFDNPDKRYQQLGDFLEKLISVPIRKGSKEADLIKEFGTGRQVVLPWYRRILYDNFVIGTCFFVVTIIQLLLYEVLTSAIEKLTNVQVGSLKAFFYVLIVCTIGSPILLLSILKGGVETEELPLLFTAIINTALLILLFRNFVIKVLKFFSRSKNK